MNCLVCDTPSENIPNAIYGKSIRCANCGDYDIFGSASDLGQFQKLGVDQRLAALERAKQRERGCNRPVITTYSV
jgi:hypothetical protein